MRVSGGMWFEISGDFVIFSIKALPNSSKNIIVGVLDDALKIKLKAPAVEGAANKELLKFLSKEFKVPKTDIKFASGEISKRKRLRLPLNEKIKNFIKREDEKNKQ